MALAIVLFLNVDHKGRHINILDTAFLPLCAAGCQSKEKGSSEPARQPGSHTSSMSQGIPAKAQHVSGPICVHPHATYAAHAHHVNKVICMLKIKDEGQRIVPETKGTHNCITACLTNAQIRSVPPEKRKMTLARI